MELQYRMTGTEEKKAIEVTGAETPVTVLAVPETIEGVPVRGVGNHAFAERRELREVRLPDGVEHLQSFAFYRCPELRRISLYDSVTDYHDGVIRQCGRLCVIDVTVRRGSFLAVRDMLGDNDNTLLFHLHMPDGDACLLFPAYVITATDNTMARTIQFDISGSGYGYRETVSSRTVDYRSYDRFFENAVMDDVRTASEIAFGRLLFPYALEERDRTRYEDFLRANAAGLLPDLAAGKAEGQQGSFAENSSADRIRYCCVHELIPDDALPEAIRAAAGAKRPEICGLLMEYQRTHGAAAGRKMFTL